MKQKKKNGYNLDDFGLLFSEASEKSMLLRKKNSVADSADSQNLVKNQSREARPLKASSGVGEGVVREGEGSDFAIRKNPCIQAPAPSLKENARGQAWDSNADLSAQGREEIDSANHTKGTESNTSRENSQSKEQDFIYAPQFQGFDEILAQSKDASAQDFSAQDFSPQDFSAPQNDSTESSAKVAPQSEKDLLLSHTHTHNDTNALFVAYSILFLMLLIFMPQVYLANNIYTSSKNINLLKSQKDALRDENSDLQKRLESVKFNFLTLEIEEIK